jgi:hypothetical protein
MNENNLREKAEQKDLKEPSVKQEDRLFIPEVTVTKDVNPDQFSGNKMVNDQSRGAKENYPQIYNERLVKNTQDNEYLRKSCISQFASVSDTLNKRKDISEVEKYKVAESLNLPNNAKLFDDFMASPEKVVTVAIVQSGIKNFNDATNEMPGYIKESLRDYIAHKERVDKVDDSLKLRTDIELKDKHIIGEYLNKKSAINTFNKFKDTDKIIAVARIKTKTADLDRATVGMSSQDKMAIAIHIRNEEIQHSRGLGRERENERGRGRDFT